jgi:hypothetical protein
MDQLTAFIRDDQSSPVAVGAAKIVITLTPEEVASQFASMDDLELARFFNHVAYKVKSWTRPVTGFGSQIAAASSQSILSDDARNIMSTIGEFSMAVVGRPA